MSKMSDGGKGSTPRPISVSQAEYESRWDAIFSRDLKSDDRLMEMPGTIGGAKIVFKGDEALDELARINEELGLYITDSENPLVKK
jgi:hypothetical protein